MSQIKFDSNAFNNCFNINHTLTNLNLHDNEIKDAGCIAFAGIPTSPLKSLELHFNKITNEGGMGWLNSLVAKHHTSLTELTLVGQGIDALLIQRIIAMIHKTPPPSHRTTSFVLTAKVVY